MPTGPTDNFGDLTMTVSGYTVTGTITEIGAGGDNDNVFYVQLTESGTADTGVRPTVLVTANTLLTDFGGSNPVVPDPAPDSKIAFRSYRDGNEEIYVMDADGTSQTNLTNNGATNGTPAWWQNPHKDYLGIGVSSQVPALSVKTRYLWTASDPSFGAVNGEDILPDIAIGRLPAASVEEARAMVAKIVYYETGEPNRSTVVLVADNPDKAGNFEADMDEIALGLPEGKPPDKICLGRLGAAAARQEILSAFDEGASLMSYVGHGGIHLWADENLLNIWQVGGLSPQASQPILLTMNCLNGYFHFPYFNLLAEEPLKAEDKGAIAAFSPSGMSLNDAAHVYHQALIAELFDGSHGRLGDAVLAAQEAYSETGLYSELLSIYHLLGDPALTLW